ncbi:molybdenum cofactor guanylyltransferase [Desulfovulcanus sp.]
MTNELCGVVLAGGKSSRLGRDKARLRFKGQELLQRSVALLQEICPFTCVVGRDASAHGLDVPWMLDDIPGIGPMGGIITALRRLRSSCLVISCDLPFLNDKMLARLVDARNRIGYQKPMTAFWEEATGFVESLVAVYEFEALKFLDRSFKKGCYKLSQAIGPDFRCHVSYSEAEKKYFLNINYPEDIKLLKDMAPAWQR